VDQYRLELWVTVAHFAEWLFTLLICAAVAILLGCVIEYLLYQRRVNRVINNRLASGRRPASDIPTKRHRRRKRK
jgi:hypothetical protein